MTESDQPAEAHAASDIARFFDGLEVLEPGMVKASQWRPESAMGAAGPTSLWGGVARKP